MTEEEFRATLDTSTKCSMCSRVMGALQWSVIPFDDTDWMGICFCKCSRCSLMMVAAAGSSEAAYTEAQSARSKVLRMIGN